jgi:hypothetical protein
MAIVQTLNVYQFRDAFRVCWPITWTYEGLGCLFDYLEEYSDSTGEPFELDVIALCCDFYEDTAEDIANNYSIDIEDMDDGEIVDAVREYLEDSTIIVGEHSGNVFVYQAF